MSTKTKTSELNATNEELKEFLASPEPSKAKPEKKKRNVWYRIFAILIALAPIAIYYFLSADVLLAAESGSCVVYTEKKLWEIFIALFTENGLSELYAGAASVGAAAVAPAGKLFGFIPLLTNVGTLGRISSVILYVIPVAMVLTLILAIIALFSGKAAPALARTITYINFWTYLGYAASITVIGYYTSSTLYLDYAALAVAGASLVLYFIFSACKVGKRSFFGLLLFLLTVAFTGAIVYGLVVNASDVSALFNGETGNIYKIIALSIMGVCALSLLISFAGISAKKLCGGDIIRSVLQLVIGGALVYIAFTEMKSILLYAAIAAGVALVHLLIEIIVLSARCSKAKKAKKAAAETTDTPAVQPAEVASIEETTAIVVAEEPAMEETIQEESQTEEPVQVAEQLPIFLPDSVPAPAPVASAPATNDYYDSKAFDPFISTLTNEERNQFTELFILKYKGELAGVPDYNVGGDNKDFFQKIFINLGSVRERIPDDLLEKLYQFAIRQ